MVFHTGAHLKSSAEKKSVGQPGHCQSFQVPCGDLRRAMPSSSISVSVGCSVSSPPPMPSSASFASATSAAAQAAAAAQAPARITATRNQGTLGLHTPFATSAVTSQHALTPLPDGSMYIVKLLRRTA